MAGLTRSLYLLELNPFLLKRLSLRIRSRNSDIRLSRTQSTTTTSAIGMNLGQTSGSTAPPSDDKNKHPRFDDPKAAYNNKSTFELIRAFAIFKMCSIDSLITNQTKILQIARKVFGARLYRWLLQKSIYEQFMAGETESEVLNSAKRHLDHNVMPMFAYTAVETHGDVGNVSIDMLALRKNNYTYMKESLQYAASIKKLTNIHTKATGKVTFLVSPETLETVNHVINDNRRWLEDQNSSTTSKKLQAIKQSMQQINKDYKLTLPSDIQIENQDTESLTSSLIFNLALGLALKSKLQLNAVQENELKQLIKWYHDLFKHASDLGVCLVNDAEQTYLQDAIDVITLDMMKIYNRQRPVVHNTYQCYLQRTRKLMQKHLRLAKEGGFTLGAKVVRGAYIEEERELAKQKGYSDPVNPDYDATTAVYHGVVDDLLSALQKTENNFLQITFATHNGDTVKYVIQKAEEIGLQLHHNKVAFAQLMGMRDHIAFPLGTAGYPSSKLLHYGPIAQGVAYMSRRLQENRSIMPTANTERHMMRQEIANRLLQK